MHPSSWWIIFLLFLRRLTKRDYIYVLPRLNLSHPFVIGPGGTKRRCRPTGVIPRVYSLKAPECQSKEWLPLREGGKMRFVKAGST